MFTMIHMNINVMDLDQSLAFYEKALGLKEKRRIVPEDQSFEIVYLHDPSDTFQLELTCLRDRVEPYDLSDNEIHLAFSTTDYEEAHAMHQEMGVICFENDAMGIYFIQDPDGYWVEILPARKG